LSKNLLCSAAVYLFSRFSIFDGIQAKSAMKDTVRFCRPCCRRRIATREHLSMFRDSNCTKQVGIGEGLECIAARLRRRIIPVLDRLTTCDVIGSRTVSPLVAAIAQNNTTEL